jgi:hypothetical protein
VGGMYRCNGFGGIRTVRSAFRGSREEESREELFNLSEHSSKTVLYYCIVYVLSFMSACTLCSGHLM